MKETFIAWGRWETRFSAKKGRDEWHFVDMTHEGGHEYAYAADGRSLAPYTRTAGTIPCWWKRPAIFMPRAASRITREITSVRLERIQAISEADAIAEGIERQGGGWRNYLDANAGVCFRSPVNSFRSLWESINGPDSWDANPWVWALTLKRLL
ncbi:hypothetical protein [Ottowia sp. VDI28]|uniref:hypothetical protein n=1 Tax=Ottowia sp. VDI28 TaxID=3133968 RepID=UPI003C2CFAF3